MAKSQLEVGRVLGEDKAFIAVETSYYDTAEKPLSGVRMHFAKFGTDDIPWLIAALRKEYRYARNKKKKGKVA